MNEIIEATKDIIECHKEPSKKIRETFIIDVEVANELRRVKKENGTPMSWILNKALRKELNMGD